MAQLNTYLNFNGTTQEAFDFYKTVFGGEFRVVAHYRDMPEGAKMPLAIQNKLMHIALKVGDNMLMGTDSLEGLGGSTQAGTNVSLSLNTQSRAEADTLFAALSPQAKITHPLSEMPWGYFGMLTDKFGIQWMVNYEPKPIA